MLPRLPCVHCVQVEGDEFEAASEAAAALAADYAELGDADRPPPWERLGRAAPPGVQVRAG